MSQKQVSADNVDKSYSMGLLPPDRAAADKRQETSSLANLDKSCSMGLSPDRAAGKCRNTLADVLSPDILVDLVQQPCSEAPPRCVGLSRDYDMGLSSDYATKAPRTFNNVIPHLKQDLKQDSKQQPCSEAPPRCVGLSSDYDMGLSRDYATKTPRTFTDVMAHQRQNLKEDDKKEEEAVVDKAKQAQPLLTAAQQRTRWQDRQRGFGKEHAKTLRTVVAFDSDVYDPNAPKFEDALRQVHNLCGDGGTEHQQNAIAKRIHALQLKAYKAKQNADCPKPLGLGARVEALEKRFSDFERLFQMK